MPDSIEAQGGPITLIFSDDGRAFFSERITGNVWEVIDDKKYKLVKHLNVVHATGHHEAGVLGIALDPDFKENGLMYAFFTEGEDLDHASNKVVQFSVNGNDEKTLISDIPGGRIHNGGVIAIGPDGKLYIGVGVDNPVKEKSQDKSYLGGKVLRINLDGSIPEDNPFQGSPVYSLGHRNVFGLAFHPRTKELYVSDVGPEKDDEINVVEPGGNYGWPSVVGYNNDPRFKGPIITYTPVITPTQMVFLDDNLYFGSYNEGTIHKLTLTMDGRKVLSDEIVYQGKPFGVIGVFKSPDNAFFIATSNKIEKVKNMGGSERMKNKVVIWVIVALVAAALLVGGVFIYNNMQNNSSSNSNQVVSTNTVNMQGSAFNPSSIKIKKGDTVTWTNNDSIVHSIVADDNSFGLGSMVSGKTSQHTFSDSGTFAYHCSIHPYMKGTVIVE